MPERGDISIVSPSLAGGGAERVAVNLANYFASQGLVVELVILQRSDAAYRSLVESRVNMVNLDVPRLRHSVVPLRQYLRRRRPTRLLSVMRDSSVIVAIASYGFREPPTMFFREANTYEDLEALGWKGALFRLAMKWSYRRAQLVIANSNDTRRDVLSLHVPRLRVEVIPNPVLPDAYRDRLHTASDHPWCRDGALQVILAVGRLEPQKDYATLVKAFALVHRQEPTARLIILGVGQEEEELRTLTATLGLASKVDFAGFVADLSPYYAAARVFVSASRWEGFGNVIVEALAAGTPVVVTDCPGGPGEIVDGGKYGDLVAVGDHQAMAAAIVRTLKAPRDARLLQARAKDFTVGRIGALYATAMGFG